MEDSEIVDLYLARDETAIRVTAVKYGHKLRRIAKSILKDTEMARECENDTYLEAWRKIPPHEPRAYLFAFLGRIVRHLAIDRCREQERKKRRAEICQLTKEMEECIPNTENMEEILDQEFLKQKIAAFVEGLSMEKRQVFIRRYWFFESISEISHTYGYTPSKVKMMLLRMRDELRLFLENEGYEV